MLGIERPDVEVLDAVPPVRVVQRGALAQGPAEEAAGVPAGALRIPPEQIRLGVGGQRVQPKQISSFDLHQRPIRIQRHTAILSRPVSIHPMLQRSVCGMCVRSQDTMTWISMHATLAIRPGTPMIARTLTSR
jgi:hypothetical protein